MVEKASWSFADRGTGQIQGFNLAGLQWFAEDPIGKVVREICQNSIDAARDPNEPVRVVVSLNEYPMKELHQVASIEPMILAAKRAAVLQGGGEPELFWDDSLRVLNKNKIRVVEFHDFNTKGLTGSISNTLENASSPWIGLVMASGVNATSNENAGGSFGIGKSAPFVLSQLRTVFYYTQEFEKGQQRFIGTSILQSIDVPDVYPERPKRQNVGHFGLAVNGEFDRPLLDDEIPSWAKASRLNCGDGPGTSVMIPGANKDLTESEFANKAVVACVSNLYVSIKTGILEVEFTNGSLARLDSQNVDAVLDLVLSGQFGTISDLDKDQLESAKTVRSGERVDLHIPKFGDVELYLRTDAETSGQNVGIARTNGQLVTRRMPGLVQFGQMGLQPFDLFIFARAVGPATIIRAFEPPSHDSLILDKAPQRKPQYEALTAGIRQFLRDKVGIKVLGKRKLGALNDIFGLANFGDKQSEQVNEAVKDIRVSSGQKTASKTVWGKRGGSNPVVKPPVVKPPTGDGTRTRSYPVADIGLEVPVTTVKDDPGLQFRITNIQTNSTSAPVTAKIWFNSPTSGPKFRIELLVAGDSQYSQVPVRRKSKDAWEWGLDLSPTDEKRRSLEIEIGTSSVLGSTVTGLLSAVIPSTPSVSFEDQGVEPE